MSVKRISIGSGTTVCYADDGQAVAYEDYADVEKLLHDAIDVLRHANKCFPLTSAQIVLARYLKLYPKGRRTK